MADDLDKFVLQYTVELKDSIGRLERLQTKMDAVDKNTSKVGGNLKEFAKGAASELDRMIPGLNAVAGAVKGMGAEFAIAGAAVGALAISISSVMKLREQMNAQSNAGLVTGLSNVRQEDLTRKLSANGNGMVDRAGAAEGLRKTIEMANEAYRTRDLNKLNQLHSIGINPFGPNGESTSPVEMLSSMAAKLSGVSPDQADALARGAGIDINWARSLRTTGAAGVSNIGMSADDVNKYINGGDDVSKLNKDLQEFHNQLNQLDTSLGELTTGPLTSLLKLINGTIAQATGTVDKQNPGKRYKTEVTPEGQTIQVEDTSPVAPATAQQKKEDQKKANDAAAKQDDAATANVQAQNKQAQLINLFAAAVGTFSNTTVDLQQAWAAWAGNIGKQGGLTGSSNAPVSGGNSGSRGLQNNNPGNLEYGAFAKSHGATGSDGRFAIFPTMQAGVDAHAALLDSNYYAKGLDTPRKIIGKYAPASENNQGNYLAYLKSRGFDPDKAITDRNGFNAAQLAFESGYGSGKGIGQDRGSLQGTDLINKVAAYIGVDPAMIARGGVSKKDTTLAISSLEGDALNTIQGGNLRLQNPTGMLPQQIAELRKNVQTASQFLATAEAGKQALIDKQSGDSNFTAGKSASPVTVNNNFTISGANMDAKQLADEINKVLAAHMAETVNRFTNGEKG
jgi:hypothetical protein